MEDLGRKVRDILWPITEAVHEWDRILIYHIWMSEGEDVASLIRHIAQASQGSEMSAFALSKPSFGLNGYVDDYYSRLVNLKPLRSQLLLWALARDERSRRMSDRWAQPEKEAVEFGKAARKYGGNDDNHIDGHDDLDISTDEDESQSH